MNRRCQKCGVEFQPNKSWQKFCTRKCHDDFHNAKHYVVGGNANPEGGETARAAYGFMVRRAEAKLNGQPVPACPKLRKMIGVDEVRRTIANGLRHVEEKILEEPE